jgi:alpha-L-fucosidase
MTKTSLFPAALTLLLISAPAVPCPAAGPDDAAPRDPLVLAKLEKFQDWKFGLMMHWGIYSQWGCIESWPLVEVDRWARPDDLKPWIERNKDFARFSADYRALNTTFNPRRFDPRQWAAAAKDAGMKYVVFTTKHHDGFCLFDTKQTDYRTTHASCPFHADPRADVVKAVFDAFRKEGFGIGAYYSKSDWHHPGYWSPDWPHPDRNVNYDTKKYPRKWRTFVDFTHAVVEELMTGYGPIDILWLDGGQVRPPAQDIDMPGLAAMARRHQPGLIVVDRTVGGRYEDYRTPEQEVPGKALPYVWESCLTMGDQWSFKPGDKYKSTRTLIRLLVDIVSKGGNFLLNVGPDADGQFPPAAQQRLQEIGRWMRVNSAAIYGTRAVAPYKEGRVCRTRKGRTIYLIVLADKDETAPPARVQAPSLKQARHVRMLGAAQAVTWSTTNGEGLTVEIPEGIRRAPPCDHAWTLAVETE